MSKIKNFLSEVKDEMLAVEWPKGKELRKNSLTVFTVVALFAVFFLGVDSAISALLGLL
ncbi:preprotein translocase subunit SecE [Lacticigenium naphthae]|uniref:preprotein translocase subunit SecE n=1 Tax=Lacticigenium naphthae TaxID=515351 RepID=UPI0004049EA3|nr:preprotein translocase subunit SecE [Lacticigenium naphthae]